MVTNALKGSKCATPLHHHQVKPLIQDSVDPCFHVVCAKFWLQNLNFAAEIDSSEQATFLQSCVQLWWATVHCSLGFLIIAARCDTQYFFSCCCSLSASSWVTVTVFILVFVVTLMIRNTVEPCVKEMKWIILASSVFCICKCLVYCFFVCIALGGGVMTSCLSACLVIVFYCASFPILHSPFFHLFFL